ncbi:MAG: hypothetical protein ACD_23C00852G0005 [uncultured bacterium]|nr:MAG: hypothetical protein ACD_23C00852G0005 [uncultured bacterium]
MTRPGTTFGASYQYLGVLALLISYGSLYPFDFAVAPAGAFLRLFSQASLFSSIGDVLGNIGLFIPWGLVGVLTIAPRRGIAAALFQTFIIGFAVAFLLQIAQLWVPSRTPALSDALWNMVGCVVGVLLGYQLNSRRQSLSPVLGLQQAIGYVLAAWVVWEWLPLIPSLDFQLVKNHLKDLLAFDSISFSLLFERAAIALLFGELLSRALKPQQSLIALPLLIAGIIFGKLFLVDAPFNASIILGLLVGVVGWLAIFRLSADRRAATVIVALLLAYSVQALAPFSLKDEPSSFGWLPFEGLLEGAMLVNICALGGSLLLFGSVLLLLRTAGAKMAVASIGLAFWVLSLELVQLFIFNRSGAITEPLLVLITGQWLGAVNFSARSAAVKHELSANVEIQARPATPKAGWPNYRNVVTQCLIVIALIVVCLKILLQLPAIPYNIKELFRADGSILAITAFAFGVVWIGAGSVWLGRQLIQSKWPGLQLFPLTIAVSLVSLLFLWSGVTSESIADIVGSSNRFWFVTNKNEWGELWRDIFLYLDAPETIGFLETCTRYWALYTLPIIFLALIYYVQNENLMQQQARFTKTGVFLAALLILWLCKAIAFDWSATDNLTELIARDGEWGWGGGGYLYGLVFLLCVNASFVAHISVINTKNLLKIGIFSLVAIPIGWWLINQGLEQNIEKYDTVFSGVQFLLGPDRQTSLSPNALLVRWCLLQVAGVLIVALGLRLGNRIFPVLARSRAKPENAALSPNNAAHSKFEQSIG